jgi:hypothetical protein
MQRPERDYRRGRAAGALDRDIPEDLVRQAYGEKVFAKVTAGHADKAVPVQFPRSVAKRA